MSESTLANPEAFNNVEALRRELHRANDKVLQLSDELDMTQSVLRSVCDSLMHVAVAHMQARHNDVKNLLDDIVAKHVKVVQKPQGGLH